MNSWNWQVQKFIELKTTDLNYWTKKIYCWTWEKQNRIQTPSSSKVIPELVAQGFLGVVFSCGDRQPAEVVSLHMRTTSVFLTATSCTCRNFQLTDYSPQTFTEAGSVSGIILICNFELIRIFIWYFLILQFWKRMNSTPISFFHNMVSKPSPSSSHCHLFPSSFSLYEIVQSFHPLL